MTVETAMARLRNLSSVREVQQLESLESVLTELARRDLTKEECVALLNLFERFPEDDAFGVFSSIVHLLEAQNGYEILLVDSVRRVPNEFNLSMVVSLINGGFSHVGDVDLEELLQSVVDRPDVQPSAKQWAVEFLAHVRRGNQDF